MYLVYCTCTHNVHVKGNIVTLYKALYYSTSWSGQETAKTWFSKKPHPYSALINPKYHVKALIFLHRVKEGIFVIPRYCARYFHLENAKISKWVLHARETPPPKMLYRARAWLSNAPSQTAVGIVGAAFMICVLLR